MLFQWRGFGRWPSLSCWCSFSQRGRNINQYWRLSNLTRKRPKTYNIRLLNGYRWWSSGKRWQMSTSGRIFLQRLVCLLPGALLQHIRRASLCPWDLHAFKLTRWLRLGIWWLYLLYCSSPGWVTKRRSVVWRSWLLYRYIWLHSSFSDSSSLMLADGVNLDSGQPWMAWRSDIIQFTMHGSRWIVRAPRNEVLRLRKSNPFITIVSPTNCT